MLKRWAGHPAFPFVAPFALFMVFLALEGPLGRVPVYPIKALCVLVLVGWLWRRLPNFRVVAPLGSVAVGIIVFLLWVGLDPFLPWLEGARLTFPPRAGGIDPSAIGSPLLSRAWVAVRLLGGAVAVPIAEELFWRGWLMRWLIDEEFTKHEIGAWQPKAFAITTVAFAVVHPQVFVALVAGAIYGWWVVRTKSLWDVVLAHGVTNLILYTWVAASGRWYFW
ncbi:MAG TPA: CAAX prenyl protease-related protein [Verrucomicrobiae bacterium]|nr:CAAX prenyl protease-related protein [Verrucomicrobiae bacterium]